MIDWEPIGVIVAISSLIITLILEWPRLTSRFTTNSVLTKIIKRLFIGCIIGLIIGSLTGWLSYKISYALNPYFYFPVYSLSSLSYMIQRSIYVWSILAGAICILSITRENIYSINFKMVINGLTLGLIFGLSIGLVALILYYSFFEKLDFLVVLANVAGDILPAAVGCSLLGGIFGGAANKMAKYLV